jgi:23S rRNA (pseudouridine1915-N3)-methyltransferase
MTPSRYSLQSITVLAVGKIKDRELASKAREYEKRISHDVRLRLESIKDSTPEQEAVRLLEHIKKQPGSIIALSEKGRSCTSKQFALRLFGYGHQACFIIGGPSGLAPAVQDAADEVLSLSHMTFPHEMAQILLLEQIYRAITIRHNRKYHK